MEACESGSMLEGLLPENIKIYATTASNATENSWATYCPGQFPSPPTDYDTCLGDLYSIAWMEDRQYFLYTLCLYNKANLYLANPRHIKMNMCCAMICSDKHDLSKETLIQQYDAVRILIPK